ncbi:primosomal protein I [Enterobacter bugandensis]|uniref:primosomal protein I n=1 Tax=Enterobacter TaxID=547 RepID=UPI00123809BC|nr:primosomal protein I [Enterobacter bugandensis]HBM7600278.1 primosomal protein I [Enterobacter asburiae]HBM7634902.1 primosomal protein I [Enterobacter asburiae]HBM7662257.1 primosomal protein I [Enterobacter asburiae]HBM7677048.1 primosomal protein I [Enterobacter asburiae]
MSTLIKLFDRPIAYQPAFAQLRVGKVKSGPTAAVLLSQFVYWHNRMDGEWMYKTREDIKKETGLSRDEQETARKRLVALGVLQEDLRGVPATLHFRINTDRLEALLLAPDRAESQMGAMPPTRRRQPRQLVGRIPANKMAATPPTSGGESHQQAGGDPANFPTGDYTETTQEITQEITQSAGENFSVDNSPVEDLKFSEWFFSRIVELHERAAEFDGTVSRPDEPDWTDWAKEVRLLREEQGCNHEQMRRLVERIQADPFWCPRVRTTNSLREKWADLVVRLCPVNLAEPPRQTVFDDEYYKNDTETAVKLGFRI